MAKNYVVDGAVLSCQFGQKSCLLKPSIDIKTMVGDKPMATELDANTENLEGEQFVCCRSTYLSDEFNENMTILNNMQQGKAAETMPCRFAPAFQWQNSHPHVFISGVKAQLQDGWTMCNTGLGIVSMITTGQNGENAAQQMQEKSAQLESAVDQYMKANNIKKKHRNQLMESILLWNGYGIVPWEYKSSEYTRDFCSYLEKENPALFNYFERGLYLPNKGNTEESIDITYLIGMYKARSEGKNPLNLVNEEMLQDAGLLNGYLEMFGIENGKSTDELLDWYLNYYDSPDYDRSNGYSGLMDSVTYGMKDVYCRDNYVECVGMSDEEQKEVDDNTLEYFIGMTSGADTAAAFMKSLKKKRGEEKE